MVMPAASSADRDGVTTSGDTQALPRIPVPGVAASHPMPTVALTIALVPEPAQQPEPAPQAEPAPKAEAALPKAEPAPAATPDAAPAPAASHERIYEEAMATIAALASSWSSAVQLASGRHRAAA
jgi:hypothetical protein